MNPAFDLIIAASDEDRLGLFTATSQRLGTTPRNVEKDFWVCWTLDALFNGRAAGSPRMLFKGGTSLSKGFGLIRRFSEDIDVTLFRDDIGEPASIAELQAMTGRKRKAALEEIETAGADYIQGPLQSALREIVEATARRTGAPADRFAIGPSEDEPQTLLFTYPSATPADDYVRSVVKIESGAKSALDPNSARTVRPYVDEDFVQADLAVDNVVTVDAERTFWDKVVILHGLRRWYDIRRLLRGGGQRISRHYYDIHLMMASPQGRRAMADPALGADCVTHARLFFNRPDFDLASAGPPTFALSPKGQMYDDLRKDYDLMRTMIFGEAPSFETVLESVFELERILNGAAPPVAAAKPA